MSTDTATARQALIDHLTRAFSYADEEQIEHTANLLTGEMNPEDVEGTDQWARQSYNRPNDNELTMHALSEVLDGHGIEHIALREVMHPELKSDPVGEPVMMTTEMDADFDYINMGDTYVPTIVQMDDGKWYAASCGDMVEALEGEATADALGIDWSKENISNPNPMPESLDDMIEAATPEDTEPAPTAPTHDAPDAGMPSL